MNKGKYFTMQRPSSLRIITVDPHGGRPEVTTCERCSQELDEFNKKWRSPTCQTCCRELDDADPVSRIGLWRSFKATYKGERYRFWTGEHFNIGYGWMCTELDKRLPPGIYASSDLTDIEVEEVPEPAPWAR